MLIIWFHGLNFFFYLLFPAREMFGEVEGPLGQEAKLVGISHYEQAFEIPIPV